MCDQAYTQEPHSQEAHGEGCNEVRTYLNPIPQYFLIIIPGVYSIYCAYQSKMRFEGILPGFFLYFFPFPLPPFLLHLHFSWPIVDFNVLFFLLAVL